MAMLRNTREDALFDYGINGLSLVLLSFLVLTGKKLRTKGVTKDFSNWYISVIAHDY